MTIRSGQYALPPELLAEYRTKLDAMIAERDAETAAHKLSAAWAIRTKIAQLKDHYRSLSLPEPPDTTGV